MKIMNSFSLFWLKTKTSCKTDLLFSIEDNETQKTSCEIELFFSIEVNEIIFNHFKWNK